MHELTEADLIWNRACEGGGLGPRRGDRALRAMIGAHGLVMNGGVLHATECLSPSELSDAQAGYRFFGLDAVADFLARARLLSDVDVESDWTDEDLETQESSLDAEYYDLIPDDSFLVERFEEHWRSHPSDFAPL